MVELHSAREAALPAVGLPLAASHACTSRHSLIEHEAEHCSLDSLGPFTDES
jgi:hypothetical protein